MTFHDRFKGKLHVIRKNGLLPILEAPSPKYHSNKTTIFDNSKKHSDYRKLNN
jgi:hypothetical protein